MRIIISSPIMLIVGLLALGLSDLFGYDSEIAIPFIVLGGIGTIVLIVILITPLFISWKDKGYPLPSRRIIIIISIIILVISSIIIPVIIIFRNPSSQGIDISSDADFKKYNFPGTGSVDDPYIIENFDIKPKDTPSGINIEYVTKHFIIRNCIIEPGGGWLGFRGINIWIVSDGIAKISNNSLKNCAQGIFIYESKEVTIEDNYVFNCSDIGITVREESDRCTISNNICENNVIGISLENSPNSLVNNNECRNSKATGINVGFSENTDIFDNELINTGFSYGFSNLNNALTLNFSNNRVNGKNLGFLKNLTNQTISTNEYGQLKLLNCTNVIIKDLIIKNTSSAMSLVYCNNCTVKNNILSENTLNGVSIAMSTNITLFNNKCSNNFCKDDWHYADGIILYDNFNVTVQNCTTSNNQNYGVYLESSDNCTILYNEIETNGFYGLYIMSSWYNAIHHNSFINNGIDEWFFGDSQAYDDALYNVFYDKNTNEGNYWSDWVSGIYYIDGSYGGTNSDPYPLDSPPT